MNKNISIIIPCYNCSNSITECLESIVKQLDGNDEIIVVDDSSKDDSIKKIEQMAKKYKFIKVYKNRVNMGVSHTRNIAIEKSKNSIITFVDSDDTVDDNYIKFVKEKHSNCDLMIFGLKYLNVETGSIKFKKMENKINQKVFKNQNEILKLDELGLLSSCCNKIYMKTIITKNNLKFNTKAKNMEDLEFNYEYLKVASSFSIYSDAFYNYLYRGNNSASSKYKENFFERCNEIMKVRESFYSNNKILLEDAKKLSTNIIVVAINNLYKHNKSLNNKKRKELLEEIFKSEIFNLWYKNKKKSFVSKIVYMLVITKNVNMSNFNLKLFHKLKDNSKTINNLFLKFNKN